MKTHSYNPHISQDIAGFELRMFENPDLITHTEQIEESPQTLKKAYLLNDYQGCYERVGLTDLIFRWKSYLGGNSSYAPFDDSADKRWTWNSIIPFKLEKRNSGGVTYEVKVYLSMLYWDTPIKAMGAKFKHLKLKYSSTSIISADTDFVDIPSDYTYHVEKAGSVGASGEERHSYLDSKVYHSGDTVKPIPSLALESNVDLTSGNLDKINSKFADDYDFRCIDSSKSYDYIMTSKDLGLIGVKGNVAYFSNDSMNLPTPPTSGDYKFYFYGQQVLVCYYPSLFKCYYTWISNYNSDNTVNWESWHLLGDGDSKFKVIVPEYFNILPIAIIFLDEEWRLIHVLDFNTSSYLRTNKLEDIGNTTTSDFPILGTCILPTLETFMKDVGTGHLLGNWLYNDMSGYEDENGETKNRLVKYWSSQLYISLQTFIQCLRFFPEYERIEVLNCGCLCSSTGKRSVFIPYSPIIEPKSNTVSMRSIPENSKVDNFVYYIKGEPYIHSLLNGDRVRASKNIKQICNGVILYV